MRETVLAAAHAQRRPRWIEVHGMRVPAAFETEGDVRDLAITDLSCFTRSGLKGPQAAAWLDGLGIAVPPAANSWLRLPSGGLIARLGETEFMLEDGPVQGAAREVERKLEAAPHRVYAVPRQDVAIALSGRRIHEVLLQTCSVDFAAVDDPRALLLTSMIGTSVLAIPQQLDSGPLLRIWADPSFGAHLWETLLHIIQELGGGPAGLASLLPQFNSGGRQ
jgi:sarcosine oxidase subunit gamma